MYSSVEGRFHKCKARLAYDGHRSVFGRDFFETSSYMPSQKAMRMFFALTASRDWGLAGFDVSQAYTIAECPFENSFMELPPIPYDSDNSDLRLGHGKGSGYIAKMKKMLYGHPSSGRFWMDRLVRFMGKVGAVQCVTDRMLFTWEFKG